MYVKQVTLGGCFNTQKPFVVTILFLGVGIDAGNGKEWESNAKSIQLIKQRGKVKVLDEEIHSKYFLTATHF